MNAPAPARPPARAAVALATAGGVGFLPVAPGTAGALVGILIFVIFSPVHPVLLGLSLAALLYLGAWASDGAEARFGRKDDGRIVIDEVVGQLVTLLPLTLRPGAGGPAPWAWLVSGFVLFRVFDIWKPGPVAWAERRFQGGMGVMMDDVVAGALGAAVLAAALVAAS